MANRSNNDGVRGVYAPYGYYRHVIPDGEYTPRSHVHHSEVFGSSYVTRMTPEYVRGRPSVFGMSREGFILRTTLTPHMFAAGPLSHYTVHTADGVSSRMLYFGPIIPQLIADLPGAPPPYYMPGRYDSPNIVLYDATIREKLRSVGHRVRHFEHREISRIVDPLASSQLATAVIHYANLSAVYAYISAPIPTLVKEPADKGSDVLIKALSPKQVNGEDLDKIIEKQMKNMLTNAFGAITDFHTKAKMPSAGMSALRVNTDFKRAINSTPTNVATAIEELSRAIQAELLFQLFKGFDASKTKPGASLVVEDVRVVVFDILGYEIDKKVAPNSIIGPLADIITELRRIDGVFVDGQNAGGANDAQKANAEDTRKEYAKPNVDRAVPYEAHDNSIVHLALKRLIKETDNAYNNLIPITIKRGAEQLITDEILAYATNFHQDK